MIQRQDISPPTCPLQPGILVRQRTRGLLAGQGTADPAEAGQSCAQRSPPAPSAAQRLRLPRLSPPPLLPSPFSSLSPPSPRQIRPTGLPSPAHVPSCPAGAQRAGAGRSPEAGSPGAGGRWGAPRVRALGNCPAVQAEGKWRCVVSERDLSAGARARVTSVGSASVCAPRANPQSLTRKRGFESFKGPTREL